ncbi:MAG: GtrA family protein [uncultured Sulfurovum sp.]|uniref:GtrA family protein n=1 Tax=uncultured Sulfurovum sp. TaxID=269237 RepID=A0A6S6SDF9_9BACT|nr:MAG: GtrA family protein [uncultured Sulfurovum sp.]
MQKTLLQFLRFNLIGIVNTLFGFSIILLLMYIGFSATSSNAIGYGLGALLSYYLNRKYTFKAHHTTKQALKFFTILAVAYILNYLTLQWLLTLANPYVAQFGSAVIYTLSSFILFKVFVFKG